MKKTILIICIISFLMPLQAEESALMIKIKTMQAYVSEKLKKTKGFLQNARMKEGGIPVVWAGMMGAMMGGFGLAGLVALRSSTKDNADKKKEIFPNVVVEDSTASSLPTGAGDIPVASTVQKSNEVPLDAKQEDNTEKSTKDNKKDVPNPEELFFPEPSNSDYDLGSDSEKELDVEGCIIEEQSTDQCKENESQDEPVAIAMKLKPGVTRDVQVYGLNKGVIQEGIRQVSEEKIDLSKLGICNEENPDDNGIYNSIVDKGDVELKLSDAQMQVAGLDKNDNVSTKRKSQVATPQIRKKIEHSSPLNTPDVENTKETEKLRTHLVKYGIDARGVSVVNEGNEMTIDILRWNKFKMDTITQKKLQEILRAGGINNSVKVRPYSGVKKGRYIFEKRVDELA